MEAAFKQIHGKWSRTFIGTSGTELVVRVRVRISIRICIRVRAQVRVREWKGVGLTLRQIFLRNHVNHLQNQKGEEQKTGLGGDLAPSVKDEWIPHPVCEGT